MRGCTPVCCCRSISSTALLDAAEGRFATAVGGTGKGEHGAVVIGVQLAVEDRDPAHGADGLDDGVDFGGVAAFGEIGDALDVWFCSW